MIRIFAVLLSYLSRSKRKTWKRLELWPLQCPCSALQLNYQATGFVQVIENLESHEFKYFSFQAWKVMEFNCWLWKGMENYSVCGMEIIAGVD